MSLAWNATLLFTLVARYATVPFMKLSAYLSKRKLSDAEFASSIDMSKTQVWRLKTGRSKPAWKTVEVIEEKTGGKVKAADWSDTAERAA